MTIESAGVTRGSGAPVAFEDSDRVADAIIERVGKNIELALPLGLGKANHVANALFARAASRTSAPSSNDWRSATASASGPIRAGTA